MQEIWKSVEESNGAWEISNKGRIWSNKNRGRFIKVSGVGKYRNYLAACLTRGNASKTVKVHRLVAEAFLPNPRKLPQVNHIDGNTFNNTVENLEWVTAKENINKAFDSGLINRDSLKKAVQGESLSTGEVLFFESASATSKAGFNRGHVSSAARGQLRQHKGFTWQYI